jgi:hypothetical protein
MFEREYLEFGEAAIRSKVDVAALREQVVLGQLSAYALVADWQVLWVPERTKAFTFNSQEEGTSTVELEFEDREFFDMPIVTYNGWLQLPLEEAGRVAIKQSATVFAAYPAKPGCALWTGVGSLITLGPSPSGQPNPGVGYKVNFAELWLAAHDVNAMAEQRPVDPPRPLGKRPDMSDIMTKKHDDKKAEIFGAAFAVCALWPDKVKTKGEVQATKVLTLVEQNADKFWATGKAPLGISTIEKHLREYLRKARN